MSTVDVATVRAADSAAISAAAALIRAGRLVAFPTETVYGLGADATNGRAVAAIFAAKGRPQFNPLIVHVNTVEQAAEFAEFSSIAHVLGEVFWPGALTLVLPRRPDCRLSLLVSAGLDTVALRVPSHPIATRLIAEAGVPLAAPSANPSGRVSATSAEPCRRGAGRQDRSYLGRWSDASRHRINRDRVRRRKSGAATTGSCPARSHRENYRAIAWTKPWARRLPRPARQPLCAARALAPGRASGRLHRSPSRLRFRGAGRRKPNAQPQPKRRFGRSGREPFRYAARARCKMARKPSPLCPFRLGVSAKPSTTGCGAPQRRAETAP